MINIEKVTSFLKNLCADGGYTDMPDPGWLAEKLANAGLLMPELPEPEKFSKNEFEWEHGDIYLYLNKSDVKLYYDELNLNKLPDPECSTIHVTKSECMRDIAYALLAAANYAERDKRSWQK